MPLKKRKVKKYKRPVREATEDELKIKEREDAMATIERLSNKYLSKSPNESAELYGIIRGDSVEKESYSEGREEEKENVEVRHDTSPIYHRSDRIRKIPQSKKHINSITDSSRSSSSSSNSSKTIMCSHSDPTSPSSKIPSDSKFRVPHPILGESTPKAHSSERRKSLFGFGDLDSPLTFSPVVNTSMELSPRPVEAPPLGRLSGMYDLPIQPTRVLRKRRKIFQNCESDPSYYIDISEVGWPAKLQTHEMEQWLKEINAEFAEIDKVKLHLVVE